MNEIENVQRNLLTGLLVLLACGAVALALAGCGLIKHAGPKPDPVPPDTGDAVTYRKASNAVVKNFWDGHCIVSVDAAGQSQALGDCLIWNGLALAALPCDLGDALEAAITADIVARGGALARAPSLSNRVSIDGALGIYRGAGDRITRCGRADVWRPVLALHRAYLDAHGGLLNEGQPDVHITDGGTDAVLAAVLALVGGPPADPDRLATAAAELVVAWSDGVELSRQAWKAGIITRPAACYRVHLGYEIVRTLETAGRPVNAATRDGYCNVTAALDLPLTDHWCGRGDLVSWTRTFQPDQYEFRHQRCPEWETPDGDGMRRPGLDEVLAQREAFNF